MSKHTNDTFTLWAVQRTEDGEFTALEPTRKMARRHILGLAKRVVKLECRIVPRKSKPKRGKYPNDNFGLPAGYTPHNPDNLNREQVGEGFRLLATVEIWYRLPVQKCIEIWCKSCWDNSGWRGDSYHLTYRIPINTPLDINPELKTK